MNKLLILAILLLGCSHQSTKPTIHPRSAPQYWRCSVVETRWAPDKQAFLRSQAQVLEITYDCIAVTLGAASDEMDHGDACKNTGDSEPK